MALGVAVIAAVHLGHPPGTAAQQREHAFLRGRVVDAASGAPLEGALIERMTAEPQEQLQAQRRAPPQPRRAAVTDAAGRFHLGPLHPGPVALRISRIGYVSLDTALTLPAGELEVSFALSARPIRLRPLTVRAERSESGGAAERALFEREVVPGVVGISRREIRAIPALAEPDVLRSLQALPGVVALNDLSAQLHVRGGGPDQNLFLLDGARIFAPYHMFGIFGAFNADAVGRVEFFRGALPARYGGALSSVVAIEQREGAADGLDFDSGLSLLAARLAARGELSWREGRWMLAARRTHADVVAERLLKTDFPYAFHDVQGRFSLALGPHQRLRASFFASSDRFRMFVADADEHLRSRWANGAGALRWEWAGGGPWVAAATAWVSRYRGRLVAGDGPEAPLTRDHVGVGGLRLALARRGEESGFRTGLDIETGRVALLGTDGAGGYYRGTTRDMYGRVAAYIEAERWEGPVRLAPGLRLAYERSGGRWFIEPRLAGRLYLAEDLALSAGLGRTYQILSTLRDDRNVVPGAPLWFLHPEDAPASRADGVSVALEGWVGRVWSGSAAVYARRFADVPRWRPVGARDLSSLAYDEGHTFGLELMVRRHAGRLTGWVGYGYGRVRLEEAGTGRVYSAVWDRHHAVDAAFFLGFRRKWLLSARVIYGTGMPFWPFVGYVATPRFFPVARRTDRRDFAPVWAEAQMRYPAYFRLDLGARREGRIGPVAVEAFINVLNVTARPNVLYYDVGYSAATRDPEASFKDLTGELSPEVAFPFSILPTIGVDVHF